MSGSAKAVALPFDEAVEYFRQKVNMPSAHWTAVMDEAHSRAFAVAGATEKSLIQDFRDAVDKAISQGTSFGEFRKDFDAIVKKHGWSHTGTADWRAKVIYQTNLRAAFAAGRYAQMTDPAVLAAFPYWEYLHVNCPNPRPQHVAWSGMVLRADDPFWASCYPPNGWGCHCIVASVNDRGLARMGKAGPDASPDLRWREYVNQKTGIVTQVPAGVDPGFVGNPGRAWKQGTQNLTAPDVKPKAALPQLPSVPRLGTTEEADKKLTAAMQPWADGLTAEQSVALQEYKGALGMEMNKVLRGTIANPAAAVRAGQLQAGLSSAVMPETVRAWRAAGPAEMRMFLAAELGETVTSKTFVSTSIHKPAAEEFKKLFPGRVIVQIVVMKGTKGAAYVHPFPNENYQQYEVLLNVGTKLRILRNDNALTLVAGEDDSDGE